MAIKEHALTIWGSKVLVFETGNSRGEIILMYDGWLGSWRAFSKILPFLENDYHMFVVATPGFGESGELRSRHTIEANADLLHEVMDRLKLKRRGRKLYLLGLSFGGCVAIQFAVRYPHYLSRLIVQGVPIGPFPRWMRFVGHFVLRPWVHGIVRHLMKSRICITLFYWANPDHWRKASRNVSLKVMQIQNASPRAVIESAHAVLNINLQGECQNIRIPTLVIDGDRTVLLPKIVAWFADTFILAYLNTAKAIHTLVPSSRLVIIPGASHTVPTQKPKEFAEAIIDFLKP